MQIQSSVRYGDIEGVQQRLEKLSVADREQSLSNLLNIAARSRSAGTDMLALLIASGANPQGEPDTPIVTPLSEAAKSGSLDKVRYLLDVGADPHKRTRHGYSPLLNAVYGPKTNRAAIVRLLLDKGVDPNHETTYGESPLSVALYFSDFEVMRLLLDAEADLSILGWTPLMRAIVFGSETEVRELLAQGADPNEEVARWFTPWNVGLLAGDVAKAELLLRAGAQRHAEDLHIAVRKDNPAMVRWLISLGADPNARDEPEHFHQTPLHVAATWGSTESAQALVEAGADVNAENRFNARPLDKTSDASIASLLVAAGADINHVNGEGYTCLKSAVERENVAMVRALLAMGAATDAEKARYSTTPLYVAVQVDDLEIARVLLEAGADPNAQNADRWFPLSNAQSIEMAKLLLDYGADLDLTDEIGKDALQHQDDPEVARYLLQRGARANPADSTFGTPLREAARKRNIDMMRVLIEHDADLNTATSWGKTALMEAAERSFVDGVKLLLEQGADVHQTDEHGRTALFYAAAPEGFESYKLMREQQESTWQEEYHALLRALQLEDDFPAVISTYGYIASDSTEIIALLIRAGADINARDLHTLTPLMFAAQHGRPARVRALLALGADRNLRDNDGRIAREHAETHPKADQRTVIIAMLRDAEDIASA